MNRSSFGLLMLATALLTAGGAATASEAAKPAPLHRLDLAHAAAEKAVGDFDQMLAQRRIRVLVPYSRTLFFNDRGTPRGMTADMLREFEQYLNRKYSRQLAKRPLTLYVVPTSRDELIDGVTQGLGDIAAGNLAITEERLGRVDFAYLPEVGGVTQIVVTGPKSPPLNGIDDLAGKTVHSRPASSHREALDELNARFKAEGRAPVRVEPLPDELEDEDRLEMLNAGLLELLVVDRWQARAWAATLPKIRLRDDLVVKRDVKIGWAIRKNSPRLEAEIEAFMRSAHAVTSLENRRRLAAAHVRRLRDATAAAEMKRFEDTIALFRTYGARYGFDPIMLAAQGYQESRLQQSVRSRSGAIGVMQVMPATAAELKVGDVAKLEPNIHAGTKYMSQLMSRYFPDAHFDHWNRPLFAFASYNAGPGRIAQLRREAAKRGYDPDKWFNSVEIVAAEKIGLETTTYVRNIYKYYVAYSLIENAREERSQARDSIGKQ